MVYEKLHSGRLIQFWPICNFRTLWTASDNFLFVDGRLAAKSGGMCFRSKAKATVLEGDGQIIVEMRTKTSWRGLIHLDYELFIDNKPVDSGTLKVSFMWKIPRDIEQAAPQRRKDASDE